MNDNEVLKEILDSIYIRLVTGDALIRHYEKLFADIQDILNSNTHSTTALENIQKLIDVLELNKGE